MKIGIIGAGAIGSAIAGKLSEQGHSVKLANSRSPDSIRELASRIGVDAVTKEQAIKAVDVLILAIPFAAYPKLKALLQDVSQNTVVIDTSNYYPFRDGEIKELDGYMPESIWVSKQIGRPVTKAWNACLAHTLAEKGKSEGSTGRIALPVAGDNMEAKNVAMRLVNATGFDALDAGTLDESWRQQPGTPAYCTERTLEELKSALESANKQRAPENREVLLNYFMENYEKLTHEDTVALNRSGTAPQ